MKETNKQTGGTAARPGAASLVPFVKKYTMVIALLAVFVLFTWLTKGRLMYAQNMSNLLLQNSYVLVMACGMLLCILTGGNIDLSVGATVCLVGAIAAQLLTKFHFPAIPTILISMGVAVLIGMWQGFWIGYVHIPPFICTLSGMFLFRGLARVFLASKTVTISNDLFLDIFSSYIKIPGLDTGASRIAWSAFIVSALVAVLLVVHTALSRRARIRKGYKVSETLADYIKIVIIGALIMFYGWKLSHYKGIPYMMLWVLAIILLYAFITSKTAFGRYCYAIGGNEKAAKLSGIDTRRVYFTAYTSMSILAGLSGLLMAARVGSVNGDLGNSYEMDAIGACFIGGASAYGGSGTVPGIVIGAILLGVINQGMSIYGLDNNWQYVVKGVVLLVAVVFDVVSNRKTGKS